MLMYQGLVYVSAFWTANIEAKLSWRPARNLKEAEACLVNTKPHCGKPVICPIKRNSAGTLVIEFQNQVSEIVTEVIEWKGMINVGLSFNENDDTSDVPLAAQFNGWEREPLKWPGGMVDTLCSLILSVWLWQRARRIPCLQIPFKSHHFRICWWSAYPVFVRIPCLSPLLS